MKTEENFRIVQFHGENFKRLKIVDITPDGHSVIISGPNEQGKSSILDAIQAALAGKDSLKNVPEPIRHGAEKAEIKIDLGDYIITRTFTSKDSYLKVTSHEGASYKNPQTILNNLFNKATIDPSVFLSLDEKKQFDTLKSIVKISVDLDALERERKEKYEERAMANKEVQSLQARFDALAHPDESLPEEETSASEIVAKIQAANVIITDNNQKRQELRAMGAEFKTLKQKKADLEKQLEDVTKELNDKQAAGKELQAIVEALEEPDIASFNNELANVEELNKKIRQAKQYYELSESLTGWRQTAEKLSNEIEEIGEKKRRSFEDAEFPIEGLGFGENGITFKNVPFTQCSQEEKIKVAFAIAMAQNPKLKVILIRDGAFFDKKNLELIQKLAKARDYQVWIERVEEGESGFIIEDGTVKNDKYIPKTEEPKPKTKKKAVVENEMFE